MTLANFNESIIKAIEDIERAFKADSHVTKLTSGISAIDGFLGGIGRQELTILSSASGMGNTTLATNIAYNNAKAFLEGNEKAGAALIFSTQMPFKNIATRILGSEVGYPYDKLRRGEIRNDDFPKIIETSRQIHQTPLYIDDTPRIDINHITKTLTTFLRKPEGNRPGIVVIDSLVQMESIGKDLCSTLQALKILSREFDIALIATINDMDFCPPHYVYPDVIMRLHREEYYEARREPPQGTEKHLEWQSRMAQIHNQAELVIEKNRHGPIHTLKLWFDTVMGIK